MKKHTVVRTIQTIRTKLNPVHIHYGLWIMNFKRHAVHDPLNAPAPRAFEFYGLSHLLQAGIIGDGIVDIGVGRRLDAIIEHAEDPSEDSQIRANIALQDFLIQQPFQESFRDVS